MHACVNCNAPSSTQSWLCVNCVSDALPFNHISDDNEFSLSLHNFFHLSSEIDISKIQSLKINPFTINSVHYTDNTETADSQNYFENNCEYMFNEDFHARYANKCSDFSLFHINARSLQKNFDSFSTLLSSLDFNFSVIAVSETWFNTKVNLGLYDIDNYSLVHICRPAGKVGGGVAIYVRNEYQFVFRNDLSCISNNYEMLFIEISLNDKSIIVACIYRPPNTDISDFTSRINDILEILEDEKKEIYLLGDFNIDLLNSGSHHKTNEFLNMMYSFHFFPMITKPTRISANRASLIDNIYSNTLEKNSYSGIIYDDLSDHFPVFGVVKNRINIKHSISKKKEARKRIITDTNLLSFRKKLKDIDWSNITECTNVDECYNSFFEKFYDIYNDCFPLKTIHVNKEDKCKKPWITKGILKSINRKNRLYKASLKNPDTKHKSAYKDYKNKLTNTIRYSKYRYYNELFASIKGDLKKTWCHINSILGKKKHNTMPNNMYLDNLKFSSQHDIVNQFNSYFINVGQKLSKSVSSPSHSFQEFVSCENTESFFVKPTTIHELLKLSSFIKISKASGPDDISPRVVKDCIHYIADPLCDIFNKSLSTGVVPEKLKTAKIVPLYKKDDPKYIDNYRPVALLSIFSKILERLMYDRLYEFLTKNNILIPEQFGFRKNYSTSLSVICFTDYILQEIDKGNYCCGVFMDLSKAFDTIDHHILLTKLHLYGIRGLPLQWFGSYLSNRRQYVVVDGVESTQLDVTLGVPQGSVLGPLLFLVYVNDIINCSKILRFSLFADDTVVLYSHENATSLVSTLNKELRMLNEWFKCNKLFLNFKKTKYVLFHSKRKSIPQNLTPIQIENTTIDRTESINFLGILIHESLDWKYHIANITAKISRSIGILSKLKSFLPRKILLSIYNALILPHLNYCSEIWGKTYRVHIDKLFILQKRAVRFVTKSDFRSPSLPLFIRNKILPIFELVQLNVLVFMFKYHKGILPSIFQNMFRTNSSFHTYSTRLKDNFRVPSSRLTTRSHSIRFTGAHEWNLTSSDLKSSTTLTRFKTIFKRIAFKKLSSMTE